MKGKVGLAIGLAAGYVLGSRAGRERFEQIKAQALKMWNTEPVQEQVGKVKEFAKSNAMALPSTVWDNAVKVTKAATSKGTPGQKLDAAWDQSKDAADDIKAAADTSASAVMDAADDALDANGGEYSANGGEHRANGGEYSANGGEYTANGGDYSSDGTTDYNSDASRGGA